MLSGQAISEAPKLKREILKKSNIDPRWIVVEVESNIEAVEVLNFFALHLTGTDGYIIIEYESCEQVPSICRLLVDADIGICQIYLLY